VLTAVATLPLSDGTIAAGQIFEPTPSPSLQSADTDEPIRHRAINQEPTHQPLLVQAPNQTEGGRRKREAHLQSNEKARGGGRRRDARIRVPAEGARCRSGKTQEQEQLASALAARGRRRKGRRDSRGGGRWAVGGPARPRNGSCRPRWLVACGVGWVCSLVGQEPGGARSSAAAGARQEGGRSQGRAWARGRHPPALLAGACRRVLFASAHAPSRCRAPAHLNSAYAISFCSCG
jgi:hypothetical protein